MTFWFSVVVATPAHSSVGGPLIYRSEQPLTAGMLVRVPLGKREVLGVVWGQLRDSGGLLEMQTKPIAGALDALAPMGESWRRLVEFTARYYQRSLGEVALAALPPQLRKLNGAQLARRLKRSTVDTSTTENAMYLVALSDQQQCAIGLFDAENSLKGRPALLFGATGSGKTEVYLRLAAKALAQDPTAQVLVMVPEINLTPQLQARFEERFAHLGLERVVALHSGLTPAQRLKSWMAAHAGQARLILGTRMAVLASMPHLKLIVVDEEHDPSYKQQEGARYSARDLAVYRASIQDGCKVLLGSATPSLESWQAAIHGKYQLLTMDERIGVAPTLLASRSSLHLAGRHSPEASFLAPVQICTGKFGAAGASPEGGAAPTDWQSQMRGPGLNKDVDGALDTLLRPLEESGGMGSAPQSVGRLPTVRGLDMNHQPKNCVIAPPLLKAIEERIARGEQSLIFLNRRGYAPVLACHDCGWKSECPHCSAYRVFHKIDRTLRCHHCGFTERVPRACPACGNIDIAAVGRGTERLEEHLAELLAGIKRPDGGAVRIARIDADSTRLKGALQQQLARVHAGEVDVLVGTQMIAKGHDFRHITLVAAINPDGALFSSDFRAPERLFSLLMQAGGRAGRDAAQSSQSEMWVQTFHPRHPLFAALKTHDYPKFAAQQLAERQAAGLSPFGYSALVRADAKAQDVAQGFLNAAIASAFAAELECHDRITAYPAVPMTIQRVANIERAQMLVESASRTALQRFLAAWQLVLFETRKQSEFKGLIRWAIDVDPLAI
jgi:primosomal protein N' (replication factor Y) (superfamily II helicase)